MKKTLVVLSILLSFSCYANNFKEAEGLVWSGQSQKAITMIDQNPELIKAVDKPMLVTMLHIASMIGNTEVAEYLLKNGADVNAKDVEGGTPLLRAKANEHSDIVDLLIAHGAEE